MSYKTYIDQYLKKHGFEAFCPKAVLFDMDGVLYDSMPNHAIAWRESMKAYGIVMTRDDAYATEGQRGVDTIKQMVKLQQGRDISETEAQTMYELKSKLFHQMNEAPMMQGALQLMEQMQRGGLMIGVVTGSGQRPLLQRLMRDYGQFVCREHIVSAYDVSRGKPYPDPYLEGLKKMGGLQPWEGVVVENAPLGVQAGAAARILTIAVNTGSLPTEQLIECGADMVFDNMPTLNSRWQELGICQHELLS